MPWLVAGVGLHYWMPRRLQIKFFAAFSLASLCFAFEAQAGSSTSHWMTQAGFVACVGLSLIGICRLPLPFSVRCAMLAGAGVALWCSREYVVFPGVQSDAWTVVGTMFMFRLAIYAYELNIAERRPSLSTTYAYFFAFPSAYFPLFPVLDCRAFERLSETPLKTYDKGLHWIAKGLVQVVLYRVIYHFIYLPAPQVADGAGLARHIFGNYGLYLHVSGHFHCIAGILCLFGWDLPETNRDYGLAESFTDYWRRVNIYWKNLMTKLFYQPVAYRLRNTSQRAGVLLGTAVAFIATWLLHAYQTYWLVGEFSLTTQDTVFWGSLAVLVAVNAAWEMRRSYRRGLRRKANAGALITRSVGTILTFAMLSLLWSIWSSESWTVWLRLWQHADATWAMWTGFMLLGVGITKVIVLRKESGSASRVSEARIAWSTSFQVLGLVGLALAVSGGGQGRHLRPQLAPDVAAVLGVLGRAHSTDPALLCAERGYYERLMPGEQEAAAKRCAPPRSSAAR